MKEAPSTQPSSSNTHRSPGSICIVGGGIIGLCISRALARRNVEHTLVDRWGPPHGWNRTSQPGQPVHYPVASWAAAGLLAPSAEAQFGEEPLVLLGRRAAAGYPEFVEDLQREVDCDLDYNRGPSLMLAWDRNEAASLRHLAEYQSKLGVAGQWLTPSAVRDLEPALGRTCGGYLGELDGWIDNRALLSALWRAVETSPLVRLLVGRAADERGLEVCGAPVPADTVVWATGALDAARVGVRPVLGEAMYVQMNDEICIRHALRTPRVYLVPRRDKRLLIGASSDERGSDTGVRVGGVFRLLEAAYELFPGVLELPILETWSGLRPATHDNLPRIGYIDDQRYIATGHYRNGILLGPITGELVADDLLEGKPPPRDFRPAQDSE